jgi:cytochrome P450
MTTAERLPPAGGGDATRKAPAGPRGHWLWGCMPQVHKDPLTFYSRVRREYGDYVRLRAVPGVYYSLLTHPEAVEHVLQKNHKNYRKPAFFTRTMMLLVGRGLFTSEGDLWLRQRRLMQPAFNRQHLGQLVPLMADAAEGFVREREAAGAGQVVDLLDEMMRLSFRVATTTLFGADVRGEADPLLGAYRTAFEYLNYRMASPLRAPVWFPTPRNRAFARAKKVLDRVVLELIEARRRSGDRPDDLLALLLAARDEETGAGMDDRQLKDEVLTLLTAGHETVGAALAWSWYLLGEHPRVQDDLADEARARLGGRAPTADDLPHLPLARAVFEEALRLYPPAHGQPREAIGADEINGFPIPAGGIVALSQYVTQRHPDFWEAPDEFRPGRFLPPQAATRPKFAYFPFGGGPRVCIGNSFALMEGPLVLASVLQKFRVELVPGHPVVPDATFTLRPKDGVKAVLRPR